MRGGLVSDTYEFYEVDPGTWADMRLLEGMDEANVVFDSEQDIKGNAKMRGEEDLGEAYVRVYLVRDGRKRPLGSWLVQTPARSHDGRSRTVNMDAYSPLLELMDNLPPVGYFFPAGANIVKSVIAAARENCHAPVLDAVDAGVRLFAEPYVAELDESWLEFLAGALAKADMEFGLDEMGDILIIPVRDIAAMQPVHTFGDDNASIVMPDMEDSRDLYGIPNIVEVVCSTEAACVVGRAENDSPSSPMSTVCRGRDVTVRDTSPDLEDPTQEEADAYAARRLAELSSVEHEVVFEHDYVEGLRVGDCVLLRFARADIYARAIVARQEIATETGCLVRTTAKYTEVLWR